MMQAKTQRRRYCAKKALLRASAFLLVGALSVVCAPYAQADTDLSAALRGLEWGTTKTHVLKHFKDAKMKEFLSESEDVRDGVLKDRQLREKMRQYKVLTETYQELKGKRTGYEVSVITGEFEKDKNEALLMERTDIAQKYYFFADGRLWKLAISYDTEYVRGLQFEAFVDQVTRKYGTPKDSVYTDEGYLKRVIWSDSKTELRIEDKSDFFGTFIMVFSDMAQTKRRNRIARLTKDNSGVSSNSKVRDMIRDIQEPGTMSVDDDIVDSIVGVDIEVGLEKTLPKEKIPRVGEDTPSSGVASADALPEETKKKKKKGKWKPRKGRKGAKGKGAGQKGNSKANTLNIF